MKPITSEDLRLSFCGVGFHDEDMDEAVKEGYVQWLEAFILSHLNGDIIDHIKLGKRKNRREK
jgi:hypothetical protein